MKKVGVILPDFGPRDSAFDLITSCEHLDRDIDLMGFYINPVRHCVAPRFAIVESYLAFSFDGALIAVGFDAADRLMKAATSKERYLYLWDLDHLRDPYRFTDLWDLFNSDITVVVRSNEIAEYMKNIWGIKEIKIAKNFKELLNIV